MRRASLAGSPPRGCRGGGRCRPAAGRRGARGPGWRTAGRSCGCGCCGPHPRGASRGTPSGRWPGRRDAGCQSCPCEDPGYTPCPPARRPTSWGSACESRSLGRCHPSGCAGSAVSWAWAVDRYTRAASPAPGPSDLGSETCGESGRHLSWLSSWLWSLPPPRRRFEASCS